MDYASAGVSIEKGDAFAHFIANQKSKAVSSQIGGFAGGIPLDLSAYSEPVMLSTTDGVGTKLLVAKKIGDYSSVGIDLVAMCVNDLAAAGADPISFLDYIACGAIQEELLQNVIKGIIKGCELADCTLVGGETAEMPDMYKNDDIDLAGFAVGIADKKEILPKEGIADDCVILGIASSGIHSNGLSLARKAVPDNKIDLWKTMLEPTRIYVRELRALRESGKLLAAAHITGGGLIANTERVLPEGYTARSSFDWSVPDIFTEIQKSGNVSTEEMRKVFNMGVGMTLIVRSKDAADLERIADDNNFQLISVGTVVKIKE
ncbi:phosphoribosylformylglycinamidine cyclo-ligase [Spirochaeta dissipatitropha]